MKTKKQNGVAATNVIPGSTHPQQALQSLRNIMADVVLIAHRDGTKCGLTLGDQTQIQQWFEIVKAALPKESAAVN